MMMKDNNLVILIDDDKDDQEIFQLAVSEIKVPVACLFFPDCEHALEHFRQPDVTAPSLVFIDINLPTISGPECLVELQKLSEFDHPRIVIHSTFIPAEWHERFVAIGVDKFMEKSVSIPVLAEKLEEFLS